MRRNVSPLRLINKGDTFLACLPPHTCHVHVSARALHLQSDVVTVKAIVGLVGASSVVRDQRLRVASVEAEKNRGDKGAVGNWVEERLDDNSIVKEDGSPQQIPNKS